MLFLLFIHVKEGCLHYLHMVLGKCLQMCFLFPVRKALQVWVFVNVVASLFPRPDSAHIFVLSSDLQSICPLVLTLTGPLVLRQLLDDDGGSLGVLGVENVPFFGEAIQAVASHRTLPAHTRDGWVQMGALDIAATSSFAPHVAGWLVELFEFRALAVLRERQTFYDTPWSIMARGRIPLRQ